MGIIRSSVWCHVLLAYLCRDTVSIHFPFFSRLKIEELEAERSKLEEENRSLEMKLEKLTVQVGNVEVQSILTAWAGPCAPAVLPDVPEFSQLHFLQPRQSILQNLCELHRHTCLSDHVTGVFGCQTQSHKCSCLFRFLYLEPLLLGASKTVPF